ncbi:MAG: hypothetical protein ACHQT6_01005 [Candidatus Acidiferrales bacterium]
MATRSVDSVALDANILSQCCKRSKNARQRAVLEVKAGIPKNTFIPSAW